MDPELGVLPVGDVLIEDGVIAAVAPSLGEPDAEVIDASGHLVAPGLIDTHRHTWQTQLRAICADWTLIDYVYGIRLALSPAYRADDVYLGNRLGAVEALDAGVTTILDFSHCNNTPQHADAAIAGLRDTGLGRAGTTPRADPAAGHTPGRLQGIRQRLASRAGTCSAEGVDHTSPSSSVISPLSLGA